MKNNDVRDQNGQKMPGGVNWTPMPPISGALPGGRGLTPTHISDSPAQVGQGFTGRPGVTPDEASGRHSMTVNGTILGPGIRPAVIPTPGIQPQVPLPAQGKVAQGRAPSSLDSHAIIPGVVADRPQPVQTPQPGKNSKDAGFYG